MRSRRRSTIRARGPRRVAERQEAERPRLECVRTAWAARKTAAKIRPLSRRRHQNVYNPGTRNKPHLHHLCGRYQGKSTCSRGSPGARHRLPVGGPPSKLRQSQYSMQKHSRFRSCIRFSFRSDHLCGFRLARFFALCRLAFPFLPSLPFWLLSQFAQRFPLRLPHPVPTTTALSAASGSVCAPLCPLHRDDTECLAEPPAPRRLTTRFPYFPDLARRRGHEQHPKDASGVLTTLLETRPETSSEAVPNIAAKAAPDILSNAASEAASDAVSDIASKSFRKSFRNSSGSRHGSFNGSRVGCRSGNRFESPRIPARQLLKNLCEAIPDVVSMILSAAVVGVDFARSRSDPWPVPASVAAGDGRCEYQRGCATGNRIESPAAVGTKARQKPDRHSGEIFVEVFAKVHRKAARNFGESHGCSCGCGRRPQWTELSIRSHGRRDSR